MGSQETGIPSVRAQYVAIPGQYQDGVALATHGRGIWTASLPPLKHLSVLHHLLFKKCTQNKQLKLPAAAVIKIYYHSLNIDMPPTGDATVKPGVTGGTTATQGQDYNFTTNGNFTTFFCDNFSIGSSASNSFCPPAFMMML